LVVPVSMPETIPVDGAIVADAGVPLVQVPPLVASASVVVLPAHTLNVPVMAAGSGLTVYTFVALQPVDSMYIIVDVPADSADTIPALVTVPTVVVPLLHVPPAGAEDKVVVAPSHAMAVPVMAEGVRLTVTVLCTLQPVGNV
jgi:hypothetical protein